MWHCIGALGEQLQGTKAFQKLRASCRLSTPSSDKVHTSDTPLAVSGNSSPANVFIIVPEAQHIDVGKIVSPDRLFLIQ